MNTIKILEKLKVLHPTLEVVELKGWSHVRVKDEYGECKVQLHSLLFGSKPTITSAVDKTEYYRNKLKKFQPNIVLLSDYKSSNERVRVGTEHGDCLCLASCLLSGKPISIDVAVDKTDYYKSLARKVHGDRYEYSNLSYINADSKVTITCKKHGDFEQSAGTHLKGCGCAKCSYEEKSGGWYNNHKNLQRTSNMYILKFSNSEENFLKFGVAVDLNKRIGEFIRATNRQYNITVIKVVSGTVDYCSQLESRFRRRIDSITTKYVKYEPRIQFTGKYECFKTIKIKF